VHQVRSGFDNQHTDTWACYPRASAADLPRRPRNPKHSAVAVEGVGEGEAVAAVGGEGGGRTPWPPQLCLSPH